MELLHQPEQAEQSASPELLKQFFQRASHIIKQHGCKDDPKQQTIAHFSEVHNGVGHVAFCRSHVLLNFYSCDHSAGELQWTIDQNGNVLHGIDLDEQRRIEPPSAALVQGVLDYFEREDQCRRSAPPEFLRELFRADIRRALFLNGVPTSGWIIMEVRKDGNLHLRASPNATGPFDWVIDPQGRVLHGKYDWWDPGDGIGSSGCDGGGTEKIDPPDEALVRDILAQLIMDRRYARARKKLQRPPRSKQRVTLRTVLDTGDRKLRTLMDAV